MKRATDYSINNTVFRVTYGDITTINADALVSSDDNHLTMGGGVSCAIASAGGDIIRHEARKHIPLQIGDVVATSAGALPAKYILHAVTIDYDTMIYASQDSIHSATFKCMQLADTLGVHHIAFPALGTGVAGFPFQLAAEVMTQTIADYLVGETGVKLVTLTLYARGGVRDRDLNLFYERATSLAALGTHAKRLNTLVKELRQIVEGMNMPSLSERVSDLQMALEQAKDILSEKPKNIERLEQIQNESGMNEISRQVVQTFAEAQDATVWEDKQLEAKVLRTKMTGLQATLNIQTSNLNQLSIDKAKYGGIGVPPRLENAIQDIKREIEESEAQVKELRTQLVKLGGAE
jgi:O-acetyl-ADP-ribose deacetylase (regulator of RNase III)